MTLSPKKRRYEWVRPPSPLRVRRRRSLALIDKEIRRLIAIGVRYPDARRGNASKKTYARRYYRLNPELCQLRSLRSYWLHRAGRPQPSRDPDLAKRRYAKRRAYYNEKSRLWRSRNPERRRENFRRWCKEHPDRIAHHKARWKARRRWASGSHTFEQWCRLLDDYLHRCAYCWSKPRRLTKDHNVPIRRGGSDSIDNILPACARCNSRKRLLTAEEFRRVL